MKVLFWIEEWGVLEVLGVLDGGILLLLLFHISIRVE